MALTEKQKPICQKYSARDADGLVHCHECPLVISREAVMCRAICHYDRRRREWVFDADGLNAEERHKAMVPVWDWLERKDEAERRRKK